MYVVEDEGGPVLVDSGHATATARGVLTEGLAVLGYQPRTVRRCLVTHVHRDHYTQAVELRRAGGMRISLGAGERPSLDMARDESLDPLETQLSMLRACGADELAHVNRGIEHGLPPAGDHVLSHITPSIGFEPAVGPLPLRDYLDSLRLVRGYADTWLLPAHGRVTDSVHARVDELLEHHAQRLTATLAEVLAGPHTAFEVAGRLRWTRRHRSFAELSPFNQMLAVLETQAHLDVLADRGRLVRCTDAGITSYRTG